MNSYETSARRRANVDEVFLDLCRQIIRRDGGGEGMVEEEERAGRGEGRVRRRRRRRDGVRCTIL